jgi:AraC-like DNA-binding protein
VAVEDSATPVRRTSFTSVDEDEITEFIRQTYVEHRSTFGHVREGASYSARAAEADDIAADNVRSTIDYAGTTDPMDAFLSFVVYSGTVRLSRGADDLVVGPGGTSYYPLERTHQFELVDVGARGVRLPMERLRQAAELMGLPGGRLRLEGAHPVSAAMERYWRATVGLVHGALMEDDSPLATPLLREELVRMTSVAALHTFPNTAMSQHHVAGPGDVTPAAVRRAAEHIEANAHRPLTLAEIAEVAGTGVRALQYGFRRHLGTTPLTYLRRVRLERAHRELLAADPSRGDTVRAIASRWGFAKPSHFAAAHLEAFGELPSQTLRG